MMVHYAQCLAGSSLVEGYEYFTKGTELAVGCNKNAFLNNDLLVQNTSFTLPFQDSFFVTTV